MDKYINRRTILLLVFLFLGGLIFFKVYRSSKNSEERMVSKNEILHLEINGVIMNGKKFLNNLKKYAKDDSVKALVVEINSPGGAVGPSQEIYYELLRTKKETKKPIICVSTSLIASGGYYSAMGCDKLLVTPGAMVGSIGVIMEFANLEKLYSWAMVQRYTITSGKFKDSGAEFRAMRDDERELFQNMINEVYEQFVKTVATARDLPMEVVKEYADGRVMTGAAAVKLKFADAEGTFEDAIRLAAQTANLGEDYHLYKPKKEKFSLWDMLADNRDDEDDLNSVEGASDILKHTKNQALKEVFQSVFKTKMMNQPLYMMPGYWD